MSIEIDDVPVETTPNMSPSWTSMFDIFLNSCRIRGVSLKFMWRSSTKNRKMRPAASLVGLAGGRMMPSCGGGRRRGLQVEGAAAVHQLHRRDVLLDAVFEHLEVVLRQVGHELAVAVADDHVGGDQIDPHPESRRALLRLISGRRRSGLGGRLLRRRLRRQRHGGECQQHCEPQHSVQTILHSEIIAPEPEGRA